MMASRAAHNPFKVSAKVVDAAPTITLILLFFALVVASLGAGGFDPDAWSAALLLICLASLAFHFLTPAARKVPVLGRPIRITFLLLIALIGVQIVPLPVAWITLFSQLRGSLLHPLDAFSLSGCCASASIAPRETFHYLVRLLACAQVFLLCRELAWRFHSNAGTLVWPILAVGAFQSALGFLQYASDPAHSVATGTYLNRNHFAGFLEMCLPFVLILLWQKVEDQRARRGPLALMDGIRLALLLTFVACVVLAQLRSLSRLGTISMLLSVVIVLMLAFPWRRSLAHMGKLALVLTCVVGLGVALLPHRLVTRYATGTPLEDPASYDVRFLLWRDVLAVAGDFPLLGVGAGAFASIFPAYQTSAIFSRIEFAHNDYLQALVELGIPGFLLFVAILLQLLLPALHTLRDPGLLRRFAGVERYTIAATAAMLALLFHSLGDYNLNVPVNALTFAWIAGLAAALDPQLEKGVANYSRL